MRNSKQRLIDALGEDFTAFENDVLSSGREFLPPCAIDILNGRQATKEYFDYLLGQMQIMAHEEEARI